VRIWPKDPARSVRSFLAVSGGADVDDTPKYTDIEEQGALVAAPVGEGWKTIRVRRCSALV
jgi:hypothetical protein